MSGPRILFAGGGTGGHVFPMLAVADAVLDLCPSAELSFVGTERGLESELVPARGYALRTLEILPLRGGGIGGAVRGSLKAVRSVGQARGLLRSVLPGAVFSIGGYAAGPVALAARTLGLPVALMEPNAAIGLSNLLIAPLVQRAYIAFPRAARHFRRSVVLQTGVPIRAGFLPAPYRRKPGSLRVLVFGGSQGALSLNQSVPRALSELSLPIEVVHQCGTTTEAETRALYDGLGLSASARVVPFIDDMPAAIADADLVIARAGASSLSEICAVGRPSLILPYPYAGDHQRYNAELLVASGAAVSLLAPEATPDRLGQTLRDLVSEPGRLESMARSAAALGRPSAARTVARDLLSLAGVTVGDELPVDARDAESSTAAPLNLAEVG